MSNFYEQAKFIIQGAIYKKLDWKGERRGATFCVKLMNRKTVTSVSFMYSGDVSEFNVGDVIKAEGELYTKIDRNLQKKNGLSNENVFVINAFCYKIEKITEEPVDLSYFNKDSSSNEDHHVEDQVQSEPKPKVDPIPKPKTDPVNQPKEKNQTQQEKYPAGADDFFKDLDNGDIPF